MEHYVGLDVSLKLTAICIIDRTGKIEREGVVASDPEAIATFIIAQSKGWRRSQACRHSAPNVDRRHRIQMVIQGGC